MKCDMKCEACTRPVQKCYGGTEVTPYRHKEHLPLRNGKRRRGKVGGVSCGRSFEGMEAR